jgi:hypothetical protein
LCLSILDCGTPGEEAWTYEGVKVLKAEARGKGRNTAGARIRVEDSEPKFADGFLSFWWVASSSDGSNKEDTVEVAASDDPKLSFFSLWASPSSGPLKLILLFLCA